MLFYLDRAMEVCLLPPGCNLLLLLLGVLLLKFANPLGKFFIVLALVSFWIFSMPVVAQRLLDGLQNKYPALSPSTLKPEKDAAIVILEASLNLSTPEYGEPTVSENTLTRIRYGAFLNKKTGIPIMVSGNDPTHPTINQADYMAAALKDYFDVSTQWKEDRGFNTAQEGIFATDILKQSGIKKIYLVTHALHMPRSVQSFQNKGFVIIPAPTGYKKIENNLGALSGFLPTTEALSFSAIALREYIGMAWYHLHYHI